MRELRIIAALAGLSLLSGVAGTGCVKAAYRCEADSDCDLGEAGRCEVDGRCTAYDAGCATRRRYSVHAGKVAGTCFDDRVIPVNPCTGGQPPASPESCFADVCAALPACCATGWSAACVQQAQLRCELACETRIALTAIKGSNIELWDLRWVDGSWSVVEAAGHTELLLWLAPPPGGAEPRLASFDRASTSLVVDTLRIPLADRDYLDASAVDLERRGRDTLVLASLEDNDERLEVLDLETGERVEHRATTSARLDWGDYDHDAFPDAVVGTSTRYVLVANGEDADRGRVLTEVATSNVNGTTTPGSPPMRTVEWADANADGLLDVIVSGNSFRIHMGGDRIRDVPDINYDCDPPQPPSQCEADLATSSFASTVVPAVTGGVTEATIVLSTFPRRALYAAVPRAGANRLDLTPLTLPTCMGCPAIVALVARDLDGDRQLDLIAIDADLRIFTGLSSLGGQLVTSLQIPTSLRDVTQARVSVSGALSP